MSQSSIKSPDRCAQLTSRQHLVVDVADSTEWVNWLYAWQNPQPEKTIVRIRFMPISGILVISGISAGNTTSTPLRWGSRQKAILTLPEEETFDPTLSDRGVLNQVQLDMGQVISASNRPVYPNSRWAESHNNQLPETSESDILVEYTAHPEARFHLRDGSVIPLEEAASEKNTGSIRPAQSQRIRVNLKVIQRESGKAVPVKLHVHGEMGEYLVPVDRHRIPNPAWFEDYSVDFVHNGNWNGSSTTPHYCTYIPGETTIDLPLGNVYIEVSKGFEIRPVRRVVEVRPDTTEILVEVENMLPWRESGWVTADTHVHFLSS